MTDNNKIGGCRETTALILWLWMSKISQLLKKKLERSSKAKHKPFVWPNNSATSYVFSIN